MSSDSEPDETPVRLRTSADAAATRAVGRIGAA